MGTKQSKTHSTHREPEYVRRKLAAAYRKRAADPTLKPLERAEFARMAEAWAKTLPKEK
ncbi:MAG: hypothetical protein NTU53_23050 [Planctomycetota bacterium]|nr:hypothetical protein [Planctomycetota bacterium]